MRMMTTKNQTMRKKMTRKKRRMKMKRKKRRRRRTTKSLSPVDILWNALKTLRVLVLTSSAHSVKRYGIMYLPHTKIILLGSASLCTEDASVMSRE